MPIVELVAYGVYRHGMALAILRLVPIDWHGIIIIFRLVPIDWHGINFFT